MKKTILLCMMLSGVYYAFSQSYEKYPDAAKKADEIIKSKAIHGGYRYLIDFAETKNAAVNVKPNTSYLVLFVYDNTKHPATNFIAHLMTKDSVLQKKYTATSYYAGEIGVARVKQIRFTTQGFSGDTRPVKFDADPKAAIYVYYK